MDETTRNTRKIILMVIVGFVAFFCIAVLVWYFFFAPKIQSNTPTNGNGLPFSNNIPPRFNFIFNNNNTPDTTSITSVTKRAEQPLVEVWHAPTAGSAFITETHLSEAFSTSTPKKTKKNPNPQPFLVRTLQTSTSSYLLFVDRTTGYVYGYNKEKDTTYQISNTLIPGVYDAYIFKNGEKVLFRYLDDDKKTIITMLAEIPQVHEGDIALPLYNTTLLPKNVSSIAVNEANNEASYLVPNTKGISIYSISDTQPTLVASNPFSEWLLTYGGSKLYATTKASAYIEGQTVTLPNFGRQESAKTGLLSTVSSSGKLFNSMWSASGLTTYIKSRGQIVVTEAKTLAPKCTWMHTTDVLVCGVPMSIPEDQEGYPDDWYQGRSLFEDKIALVDGKTGQLYPLFTFTDKTPPTDLTKITISENDKDIVYIRKQNGSLWMLKTELISSGE
jgi:hypothetical protein